MLARPSNPQGRAAAQAPPLAPFRVLLRCSVGGVEQFGAHHVRHFHTGAQAHVVVEHEVFEDGILAHGHADGADDGFLQGHLARHAVEHAAFAGGGLAVGAGCGGGRFEVRQVRGR